MPIKKRYILLAVLFAGLFYVSFFIQKTYHQKSALKADLIELSDIKYGLFNTDEWKKSLAEIVSKKINEFEIDSGNKSQMKSKISGFLYDIIEEYETKFYKENSNSISGFFKNTVAKFTNTFRSLKNNIPTFTDEIVSFLEEPKNKKALKEFFIEKIDNYADETFAKLDYSTYNSILEKHQFNDKEETLSYLYTKIEELEEKLNTYKYILVFLTLFTASIVFFSKEIQKTEYIILAFICFLLLLLGLVLPMIEIDARISKLNFSLLGEELNFKNQVLYYKSKSILEVIKLMITQSGFDILIVGILVFIFSVLFPISKLTSLICVVLNPRLQRKKFIHFLIHKTGKWSMADVMVVAIFMAYIGFSGILSDQLNQIQGLSTNLEVLTTNNSSLEIGFFAFTSFALLSLLVTSKLKREDVFYIKPVKELENETMS